MPSLHTLLARQIARLGLSTEERPDAAGWMQLLERVSRAYQESEQDRYLLERSQDLASAEMLELYRALEDEKAQLDAHVRERTQKLRESESHLAEAQRLARVGSWINDIAAGRIEWSEECLPAVRPRSRAWLAVVLDGGADHPSRRPAAGPRHAGKARREGVNGEAEFRIVLRNGRTQWLHAIEESFKDAAGKVTLMRGTLREITAQKEAELARDLAIERFNIAMHGSDLVLFDVDPDGAIFLSERWNVLLGGEPRETHTNFEALMA